MIKVKKVRFHELQLSHPDLGLIHNVLPPEKTLKPNIKLEIYIEDGLLVYSVNGKRRGIPLANVKEFEYDEQK